jgi:cytochrome P450 family 6
MCLDEVASNIFLFFVASSESSSSAVAYTVFELSRNQQLLNRAQEDIRTTLEKYQGELTYESIMDMKFIDLCMKETLRKYPGLPLLNRECSKDYQIPGSKFTIEKGMAVVISLLGIHRDEKFFPNAMRYNPDRFSDEEKAYREDMYMPFGTGPRSCIGEQFH